MNAILHVRSIVVEPRRHETLVAQGERSCDRESVPAIRSLGRRQWVCPGTGDEKTNLCILQDSWHGHVGMKRTWMKRSMALEGSGISAVRFSCSFKSRRQKYNKDV